MHARLLSFAAVSLLLLAGCAAPDGETAAEKQAYTLRIRDEALAELDQRAPEARGTIAAAPGYIFVSGFAIHPGFLTFGNAYGVVQDNRTGEKTFIRLTRFAVGPGIAVKGYYGIVTLANEEAVKEFQAGRWYGVAFADATFHFGDTGGSASAGETAGPSTHAWVWTHTGVSLEVAAGGGKLYPADDVN
jgi:hypothetical protein